MDRFDKLTRLTGYVKLDNPNEEIEPQEDEKLFLAEMDGEEYVIHTINMVVTKIISFAEIAIAGKY